MKKKRTAVATSAILLVVVGLVWGFSGPGEDPQLEKVKQLQSEITAENVPPEQRREKFSQLRTEMEKLPEEKRKEAGRGLRDHFRGLIQKRIDKYFSLPEDEQVAYLDEQIDEMEKWRKEAEKRREEREKAVDGEKKEGDKKGSGRFGNWRNMSDKERDQRKKQMLDNTTAKQRAQFMEYFTAIRNRREQLGLPPMRWGGPGRQ